MPADALSALEQHAIHATRRVASVASAVALGALVIAATAASADAGPAVERVRVVSAPDCVDAANFVAEFEPAPRNVTYMRVQHVGDVGTDELAGQVANAVTWDVGLVTGLSLPPSWRPRMQRGFRDVGPPEPSSAFQLACNAAGFYLDSRRFGHRLPLVLEGPSVSIARDLDPPADVFRSASSALVLEATVRLPSLHVERSPVIDGTAQVSFMVYFVDATTGTVLTHVVVLFDNRSPGVNGAGAEEVSADAYNAFVVSPLAARTPDGSATQFVTVAPGSASTQFVVPWTEPRFFRMRVSYSQFQALLARVIRDRLPHISPRPEDYRVTLVGVLGEIFPGTGSANEVALGGSVTDVTLAEAYAPIAPVTVLEYRHAGFDHYFVTSHAPEIADLDAGKHAGWRRTGASFLAWPAFVAGSRGVCRYYLPPAAGDSHFFSASRDECRHVGERHPAFVLEGDAVMFVALPDPSSGECPADTLPMFRLWNARADTNHRYTTDAAVRASMAAAGWVSEGYGPQAVAMCAPAHAGLAAPP